MNTFRPTTKIREMEWDAPLKNLTDEGAQRKFFERQKTTAAEKGYKAGWAAVRFKSVFGKWPKREWVSA